MQILFFQINIINNLCEVNCQSREKYQKQIINRACQKSLNQRAFTYHIVKQLAEEIRLQKQIQTEINFIQENEIIRPTKQYQQILTGEE